MTLDCNNGKLGLASRSFFFSFLISLCAKLRDLLTLVFSKVRCWMFCGTSLPPTLSSLAVQPPWPYKSLNFWVILLLAIIYYVAMKSVLWSSTTRNQLYYKHDLR